MQAGRPVSPDEHAGDEWAPQDSHGEAELPKDSWHGCNGRPADCVGPPVHWEGTPGRSLRRVGLAGERRGAVDGDATAAGRAGRVLTVILIAAAGFTAADQQTASIAALDRLADRVDRAGAGIALDGTRGRAVPTSGPNVADARCTLSVQLTAVADALRCDPKPSSSLSSPHAASMNAVAAMRLRMELGCRCFRCMMPRAEHHQTAGCTSGLRVRGRAPPDHPRSARSRGYRQRPRLSGTIALVDWCHDHDHDQVIVPVVM